MKTKLLAAAIAAGLVAPVASNAAPTLYGQLQAEISSEDRDNNNTTADGRVVAGGSNVNSSGSIVEDVGVNDNKRGRLGVKGSEDLGGGLKAIYKFEFQVETTTGDVDDGNREAYVGLKGSFGTVRLGNVKSPYKYYGGVKYDPLVATEIEARRYGGMSTGDFGQNGFLDRNLNYENKFGMVSFWGSVGLSEQNGEDGDLVLGIKFGNKKWEAGFAYAHDEDINNDTSTGHVDQSYDAMKIFGKVKVGSMVTLKGQFEDLTEEQTSGADQEGDILFLGADFKFGKSLLVVQLGQGTWEVSGSPDQESDYFAVGFIHKFSKKTRAFVGFGNTDIDNMNNSSGTNNSRDALTAGMRIDF